MGSCRSIFNNVYESYCMKKILLLLTNFLFVGAAASIPEHPHILVKEADKVLVLDKIKTYKWARDVFEKTQKEVDGYVQRHQADSAWILDRYLMNRVPGKRYTHFVSDHAGTKIVKYMGDAPVPTVRVSPHKRFPICPEGKKYIAPAIEEVVPKDTSMTMLLMNPVTHKYDRVDPQSYVHDVNARINDLAYKAAVMYWLTGEENYAKLGADILNQWVNAAVHQYPIEGPGRVGFLDIQTLGDDSSYPLILAHDFLYDYLKKNNYPMENYDTVFERIAWTMVHRGYAHNNWFAAETTTLVAAALGISDEAKRKEYLEYFLDKDYVSKGCGQISLRTATKRDFTPDGHWKEPGSYHNYPVDRLLSAAMMMENNGFQVFKNYPILLQAAYVMLKYSFPDMTASAIGDSNRPKQSSTALELALKVADRYKMPVLPDLVYAAKVLESKGEFDRSKANLTGLLCYLPKLPAVDTQHIALWNRSEKLDFASCFLQRNGMDEENGLMYVLQGGTYNHNHSNGISMELYGSGTVMGIDPGKGLTYEHPLHVNYYTQWGAHNTVVAGGSSYSLNPFTGGGGLKKIGAINLVSMEPAAAQKALSENVSYTYVKYLEGFTKTNQERLMGIFRVDDEHGFYVDMYRSDHAVSNDYLYHNIGDEVKLYDFKGAPVGVKPVAAYPTVGKDYPGLRFFTSVKKSERNIEGVHAVFTIKDLPSYSRYMNLWMPQTADFTYYTSLAPQAMSTVKAYSNKKVPVVAIRAEKSAADVPFMVVYEPSSDKNKGVINAVKRLDVQSEHAAALRVETVNKGEYIFVNAPKGKTVVEGNLQCAADLAVFGSDAKKKILYVGHGSSIENEDFLIQTTDASLGDVLVEYSEDELVVKSNQKIQVKVKKRSLRKAFKLSSEFEVVDSFIQRLK